ADRRSLASPKGPDTSIACVRAYPPRSHHNSLSSPFNQHPAAGVHPAAASRALLRTSSLAAVPRAPACRRCPDRRSLAPPMVGGADGGGERVRTDDLLLAKQALSQ